MHDTKNLIERELKSVNLQIENLISSDNEVSKEIQNFITKSSKRIRSILAILYLKSNDIEITDNIISVITAGEIIHNASLLHDDVIDNSQIRRGEKTIGAKFSPTISILAGDLLLSKAVKILMGINNSKVLDIFLNCTEKMSQAEINQFLLKDKIMDKDSYISICKGKTSSLFSAILESVALLSNLDTQKAKLIGEYFGILFQIKNDLEPVSAQKDIQNKTQTAPSIFGVEKTLILFDNYKEKFKQIVREFENKLYSEHLSILADKI